MVDRVQLLGGTCDLNFQYRRMKELEMGRKFDTYGAEETCVQSFGGET
jgi:hypothetical protein